MTRRALLALFAALALVATACGGSDGSESAVDTSNDTTTGVEAVPTEAPSEDTGVTLVADTVTGGQIDFGALQGQDVVLWFCAPW